MLQRTLYQEVKRQYTEWQKMIVNQVSDKKLESKYKNNSCN